MVSAAKRYAAHPKSIFGLKCSQHRAFKMTIVLKYYQKSCGAKAPKQRMLTFMAALEKEVTSEESDIISEWLQGMRPAPLLEERLEERLNDCRGIDDGSKKQECSVCLESFRSREFPKQKLSVACQHESTVCGGCVTQSLDTQIPDVSWDNVTCPECPEALGYDAIQKWASADAFEKYNSPPTIHPVWFCTDQCSRYNKKSLMSVLGSMPNLAMCLGPGCDSG